MRAYRSMSARRSGSFMLSARDKSSNPLARYSLVRFTAPLSRGLPVLSSAYKIFAAEWFQSGLSSRAKLTGWHINRTSAHASASDHLVPLEQKTAYGVCPRAVSDAYQRRLMECHARRPPEFPRAALFPSDAWLSCAGPGELAPEVGILTHLT